MDFDRLRKGPNSLIQVVEVALERASLSSTNAAIPIEQAFDVARVLAVLELVFAELGAILTEVTGVAAAREALIRSQAAAAPAVVT